MMLKTIDGHERWLVRAADAALAVAAAPRRRRARPQDQEPQRILLLRLERIGDLVMTLEAIRDVRTLAPSARIDLVVGSWNAGIARAIPNVNTVETLDARWLAREREGQSAGALVQTAWAWRERAYDLAINFEPDIRSNLVLAATGAARTVGWSSGGGGPILDLALDYDTSSHTAANARRLVSETFGRTPAESARPVLLIPESVAAPAATRLRAAQGRAIVGVHVSGGRAIKQWDATRFADVAARLADERGAAIVATGSPADRPLVDGFIRMLHPRSVIDAMDEDLLRSAAVLSRIDLLITGDTGPMHLASAVGTPVVAIFGPSDPARYAPQGHFDRVVRVDLPCSPCNRIRRPPARCVGHTPDCLVHVSADDVFGAAVSVLDAAARRPRAGRP